MQVKFLRLSNFLPFKLIKELDYKLDIMSNIVIIIGCNGSGKTNLLSQLSPYYNIRNLFQDKEGYKHLIFTYQDNEYSLITDFSNSSNPHSFRINNIEMNINGSQQVQHSLIEQYLNYSSILDECLRFKYRIASMNKSERRELFFKINPVNLEYIIQLHKETISQIKFYKANLKSLNVRKGELETKILDTKILDEYTTKQTQLNQDIQVLNQAIIIIDKELEVLKHKLSSVPNTQTLSTELSSIQDKIQNFKFDQDHMYNTSTLQENIQRCKVVLSNKQLLFTTQEHRYHQVLQELKKYKQIYQTMKDNQDSAALQQQIYDLKIQITSLEQKLQHLTKNTYLQSSLSNIKNIQTYLSSKLYTDLLYYLQLASEHISTKILLPVTYDKVKTWLHHKIITQQHLQQEILDKQSQVESIQASLAQYTIPDDCSIDACSLKLKVNKFFQDNTQQLNTLLTTIALLQRQFQHNQENIDNLQQTYDINTRLYQPIFTCINQTYSKYQLDLKQLVSSVFDQDITNLIRTNPLIIISHIDQFYIHLQDLEKFYYYQTTLTQLLSNQEQLQKLTISPIEDIQNLITTHQQTLTALEVELQSMKSSIKYVSQYLQYQEQYHEQLQQFQQLISSFYEYTSWYITSQQQRYLIELKTLFYSILKTYEEDLQSILIIKQEQTILISRYNEEVMKYIYQYTQDQKDYKTIEQALSPSQGIPYKIIQNYLNQIINNTNFFISKVWTYPLQILPIDDTKPIDYLFPYLVGDDIVSDISHGSEAQQVMIDLAIMLSILVLQGWTNFPLYLDEIDKSFDPIHKTQILDLLQYLLQEKIISQLFLVGHHISFYDGIKAKQIIDLNQYFV